MTSTPLAAEAAGLIAEAFTGFRSEFRAVTRRAAQRFAARDWGAGQHDAAERLALYPRVVGHTVAALRALAGERTHDEALGRALREAFARAAADWPDAELAETFYNSVVRRVQDTVGVNAAAEFTASRPIAPAATPLARSYHPGAGGLAALLRRILLESGVEAPFRSLDGDTALAAERIEAHLRREWGTPLPEAVEMLPTTFYRNKGAYRVGRMRLGERTLPLLLPLTHPEGGVVLDAVLLSPDDASVVFGFTRSYFHADVERPCEVVAFLRSIMPLKRTDELYIAIGYHKHAKTELYRELMRHLREGHGRFERAEGERGLVMLVFTLPSLNVVFKVIRDRFGFPKEVSHEQVRRKYDFVFVRDRVGRLADAQEFEHLEFERAHFEPALLAELQQEAASLVRVVGDRVVIEHLYTERRVTPLNLYLQGREPAGALEVLEDYGRAIKDLAAANIFPGDMLLKNFGVTRHGRVIFYDYDELCLLTECNFRRMPRPRDDADEWAAEPFFHVAEGDVFPEEFENFLVPRGPLREAFLALHPELMDASFWRTMQQHQQAGEIPDFFPYPPACRLRPDAPTGR